MAEKVFEFDNFVIADQNTPAVFDLSVNRHYVPEEASVVCTEKIKRQPSKIKEELGLSEVKQKTIRIISESPERANTDTLRELTIKIGDFNVSAQEFAEADSEAVFMLNKRVNDDVDICLDGHKVAEGKLLEENGRLMVLLTKIAEDEE